VLQRIAQAIVGSCSSVCKPDAGTRPEHTKRSKGRQSSAAFLLLLLMIPTAHAQFFATCRSGSAAELDASIHAHEEHMERMSHKFVTGWYRQGALPPGFQPVNRADVLHGLSQMGARRAAVLFQSYDDGRFCSWLITPHATLVSHVSDLSSGDLRRLQPRLIQALGVDDLARNRAPQLKRNPNGAARTEEVADSLHPVSTLSAPWAAALQDAASVLLPMPIRAALHDARIDTLIVVPMAETSTVPFAALPFDSRRALVDVASVMVAPGLFIFREAPVSARKSFPGAVVVGNPLGWQDPDWTFQPLAGAQSEAEAVAKLVNATALTRQDASKRKVLAQIKRQRETTLIYLATHGIADDRNPLDAGFLLLSDGRWTAREIARLPIANSRPLVVLSACQSGLGKNFDVGTIGLARAWHQAGAANVVMSLWNVSDTNTNRLMQSFITHAQTIPPDKALQAAMQELRRVLPNPLDWASFAVFGLPEL
jgi:hypothetical protein